jgi:hypothetical protein
MREPAEDPDAEAGEAWTATAARQREAVAQAAVVPMRPARKVVERERDPARKVREREADFEAGG